MKFEDGKYEVVFDENNIPREVLRYGEPWRDILGDKFLALVLCELQESKAMLICTKVMVKENK